MKKTIILILLLITGATTFGQPQTSAPTLTKQDYLQKSKNQKKVAWILLGGGAAAVATGAIIPRGERTGWGLYTLSTYENDNIKASFILVGLVSMTGSIPFFLASGKNKRKAMRVSFRIQEVPNIQTNGLTNHSLPSLKVEIVL